MKQCRWSKKEISYIKKYADKFSVKHMAIHLDRSEKAVRAKLERIGCSLKQIKHIKGDLWTEQEDNFLKNNYMTMTVKELSILLNRTPGAISSRKFYLKLNRKYDILNANGKVYKSKNHNKYDLFYDKKTNTLRAYHRVVYENYYNTKLKKEEKIHHIDGNKKNNEPINLLKCANTKRHREVHAQLEKVAYQLIQEGFIIFDKEKEEYIANSNRRLIKN